MNRTADQRAYFAVNIILAGVILLIMGYSGFYSPDENEYPVVCIHEKLTGEQCPSCGLSHAFSLIIRGRIDEALLLNSASLRVFLFFALQLGYAPRYWSKEPAYRSMAEADSTGRCPDIINNGAICVLPFSQGIMDWLIPVISR